MKYAAVPFALLALFVTANSPRAETVASFDSLGEALDSIEATGGVLVHLGCGDGSRTVDLLGRCRQLHAVDTDPDQVAATRARLQQTGAYGTASADRLDGDTLPYIDNFVNLIVAEDLGVIGMPEVDRVLAPGGAAITRRDGKWTKWVKPRPDEIDQWTHYLYDSSNNAVAKDRLAGPPRRLQWVGGPRFSRHHDKMASLSALVSAGGRVFYVFDEAPRVSILLPPKWQLIARDAFNGTVLWKRSIERWHSHLWPLKNGPSQLPRRLVASGDRVYATLDIHGPVIALDAATGETIHTYQDTMGTEEIVLSDGILFVLTREEDAPQDAIQKARAWRRGRQWNEAGWKMMALRAKTGEKLWQRSEPVLPTTMAVDGRHVVFHNGTSVVCLDRQSGQRIWKSKEVPRSETIAPFYSPTLVLYQGTVLFSGGETAGKQTGSWYREGKDTMTALDGKTGQVLWSAPHPPSGYRSAEDLLVVDGLVWTGETTSGRAPGLFTGRDPHSGEVKKSFTPDIDTYWFHHRCYRGKATDKFLLMSRTGIEFVDVQTGHWEPNHFVRGACLYGVMPANGLIYAPQHPCACYLEAKLSGFNALAPMRDPTSQRLSLRPPELRLEMGAASGQVSSDDSAGPQDWPTYRHNASRSGQATTEVPRQLRQQWKTDIGGRLSSPIVAEGKLFVASIDRHQVHAVDARSGELRWHYTAGGRVDSPPTWYKGCVYFGSADGWVYCLRAADGKLVWRFLAAPADRRLMALEQLESIWPVHGSVLVQDDVLYFVAGRSMFLDGGLRLWRLDATTGSVLSETVLDDVEAETGKGLQEFVSWLNMPTGLPDVLSSDGRFVYMRSQPFEMSGKRLPLKTPPRAADADQGAPEAIQGQQHAHLFSPTGFLDDSWWHRSYWMYGTMYVGGWQGYYRAGKTAPAGRILVHDQEHVYGFGRKPKYWRWTTPLEHHLFAVAKSPTATPAAPSPQMAKVPGFQVEYQWTVDVPLHIRGMVLAEGTLFVAGPEDLVDEEVAARKVNTADVQAQLQEQLDAWAGRRGGVMWAVNAADGKKLSELDLSTPPVFDGMAAANQRLYVVGVDGSVACFAGGIDAF